MGREAPFAAQEVILEQLEQRNGNLEIKILAENARAESVDVTIIANLIAGNPAFNGQTVIHNLNLFINGTPVDREMVDRLLKLLPNGKQQETAWPSILMLLVPLFIVAVACLGYLIYIRWTKTQSLGLSLPLDNQDDFTSRKNFNGTDYLSDINNKLAEQADMTTYILEVIDYFALLKPWYASASKIVTLEGFLGTGKTWLAVHFFYQEYWQYVVRIWLDASSENNLVNSLINIMPSLKISFLSIDNRTEQALEVRKYLEQNPGWLLVLDNAPSYDQIEVFLPRKGGDILITSNHENWRHKIKVGNMQLSEAKKTLITRILFKPFVVNPLNLAEII